MGITIKELSENSGYSTATISRVISGTGSVKKETKEAIEKLLVEYNYRTNAMEIRKKSINNRTIMILVGDLDNWYYMESVRVLNRHIWENEYIPIIVYTDNQIELEEEYVRLALLKNYAGIIFINVRGNEKLKEILTMNQCPVVFLNRKIKLASFDTVCSDNYHGGYQATTFLISKGHKRIGHLMGSVYSNTAVERRRGYEDAMRDNGLIVTENNILLGDLNYKESYICGEKVIKSGLDFTAIFCSGYQMMEGVLDAFTDYGVKVPDDISIICFDETPATKRKNITTVWTDQEKMGATAVKLLIDRIKNGEKETSTIYLETKMCVRGSVKDLNR